MSDGDDLARFRERRRVRQASGNDRQWVGSLRARVAAKDIERGRLPINRRRITLALDARGLYGPEVDTACGVEEPAVDKWETGELVPTPEQVAALAALTGMAVEFFYREDDPAAKFGAAFICGTSGCHVINDDDYAVPAYVAPLPQADGRLW